MYDLAMNAINTPTYLRLREQIRSDIVDGIWALGSHVTLAQLSDHYQVSAQMPSTISLRICSRKRR